MCVCICMPYCKDVMMLSMHIIAHMCHDDVCACPCYSACMSYLHTYASHMHRRSKENLVGVGTFLLLCGTWGLSSSWQSYQQVSLSISHLTGPPFFKYR